MDRMLNTKQVMEALGCSVVTLYRLRRNNQFPQPLKLGRVNRWRESAVTQWMDDHAGETINIQGRTN